MREGNDDRHVASGKEHSVAERGEEGLGGVSELLATAYHYG